jgi:hypothetical protein
MVRSRPPIGLHGGRPNDRVMDKALLVLECFISCDFRRTLDQIISWC